MKHKKINPPKRVYLAKRLVIALAVSAIALRQQVSDTFALFQQLIEREVHALA